MMMVTRFISGENDVVGRWQR